jgi:hypothetical protein
MKKNKLSNSQNPMSGKVLFDHTSNIRAGLYFWVVDQSRVFGVLVVTYRIEGNLEL